MRRFIGVAAGTLAAVLTLSGCMWQTASGVAGPPILTLSGSVTGFPITGTYRANVTGFSGTLPGCLTLNYAVTLTDSAGDTVTKRETKTGCSVGFPTVGTPYTVTFFGNYNVTGGTGKYAGATGSGSSILTITWLFEALTQPASITWSSLEFGDFRVPGIASAANTRKRTFKAHGTVSRVKLCKNAGKHDRTTKRSCVKLTAEKLNRLVR